VSARRRRLPGRAVGAPFAASLLAGVTLCGAAGCNILENVIALTGECHTSNDCAAGDVCKVCSADAGCGAICVPVELRTRAFLDDDLVDAGVPPDDAGVVDAGPEPGPAILEFLVYADNASPQPVTSVAYGTKPGVRYTTRGMASCEVFMPGEDLVGYEDYAPTPRTSFDYEANEANDFGLLKPTTVTLTCVTAPTDGGTPEVRVRSADLDVTCEQPVALPPPPQGSIDLSGPLRTPTRFCGRLDGDLTLTGTLGMDDADGGSLGMPRDVALARMLADVIAIDGSLVIDAMGETTLVGLTPPPGGLAIERVTGGLALQDNPVLTDLSALNNIAFEGAGDLLGDGSPVALLIEDNAALVDLTGLTLGDAAPGDLLVRNNPVLNPAAAIGGGTVSGAITVRSNNAMTGLAWLAGVTSAEALIVESNPVLADVTLNGLGAITTGGLAPDDQTLRLFGDALATVRLPALMSMRGDLIIRNEADQEGIAAYEVGGLGTSWDGAEINVQGATDTALRRACELLFNEWDTDVDPAAVSRAGELVFWDAASCPPE
jgi:hypothetical protein